MVPQLTSVMMVLQKGRPLPATERILPHDADWVEKAFRI